MKIKDPALVEITDDIEEWAAKKYGAPHLPALFLQEFKDSCLAKGRTYADAEQAFKNWINGSAPAGRFYKADVWETRMRKAKRQMHGPRTSQLPLMVAGRPVTERGEVLPEAPIVARSSREVASAMLAKMRGAIK